MFPESLFLFGFSIHPFGIAAAVSLMLGYVVTYGEMKRLGMPVPILPDLAFAVMIGAFLGARGFFVLECAAWLAIGFFHAEPTWISRVFVSLFLAASGIQLIYHVVQHEGEKATAKHLVNRSGDRLCLQDLLNCSLFF